MEPTNDPKLSRLLHEWKVENAPRSLDERVLGPRHPWWMRLLRGSIPVPVPLAAVLAVLLVWMAAAFLLPRPAAAPTVAVSDFQPTAEVQVRIIRSANVDR